MEIEKNKFIYKRFRNGDEAFEKGDLPAAIQLYVMQGNADKLLGIADFLSEKGRQDEADKVYRKAHEMMEEKLKRVDK